MKRFRVPFLTALVFLLATIMAFAGSTAPAYETHDYFLTGPIVFFGTLGADLPVSYLTIPDSIITTLTDIDVQNIYESHNRFASHWLLLNVNPFSSNVVTVSTTRQMYIDFVARGSNVFSVATIYNDTFAEPPSFPLRE